jgi:hypothetical protein
MHFLTKLKENERKISAPVDQKLTFSSSFLWGIEDTKKSFRDELTFIKKLS